MYTEQEARQLVIKAGHMLTQRKLIARTWGNISARISEDEFIITPSGRSYDDLKEEELVKVKLDLSYEGDIKPSSEKGIHSGIYELRRNASFIIHTHQFYASALCAEEKDVPFAPCAKYALPGTKELKDNVMLSVAIHPESKAFLMAKHGAVCFGESLEDAFDVANSLEENSKLLFEKERQPKSKSFCKKPWIDDYAQLIGFGNGKTDTDDIEAVIMITEKNTAAAEYVKTAKPLSLKDTLVQRGVYLFKYSKLKNRK